MEKVIVNMLTRFVNYMIVNDEGRLEISQYKTKKFHIIIW